MTMMMTRMVTIVKMMMTMMTIMTMMMTMTMMNLARREWGGDRPEPGAQGNIGRGPLSNLV